MIFFITKSFIVNNVEVFSVNRNIGEFQTKHIYIKYSSNNYNNQLININIITKLWVNCCSNILNIPIIYILLSIYNLFILYFRSNTNFYKHYCKWKIKHPNTYNN